MLLPLSVAATWLALAVSASLAHSHSHSQRAHHDHIVRSLPKRENARAHLVTDLFKRQAGVNAAAYPKQDLIGPDPLPAWVATYNTAKAAGLIPNFPNSTNVNGWPQYPASVDPNDPNLCSWSLSKCNGSDIVNAPDGMIGISFDDGPQAPSGELYSFLQKNRIPSTHFVIGSRILEFPDLFKQVVGIGGQIAVHTWSHPLMSSLTDTQVLGELGWTLQVIYDMSGGIVPAFWRPPYGDVDNRVRAIAKEVFGLTTVIWNKESNDWCLADDGTNACPTYGPMTDRGLERELTNMYNGPQSPGLIILEHEHHNRSITGFVSTWPTLIAAGWNYKSIPDLFGMQWYQNGDANTDVTSMAIGNGAGGSASAGSMAMTASIPSTMIGASAAASTTGSASAAKSTASGGVKADSHTGWQSLATGVQWGIIGGAAGLAVILIGLVAYCCRRSRKTSPAKTAGGAAFEKRISRLGGKGPQYSTAHDSPSALSFDEKAGANYNYGGASGDYLAAPRSAQDMRNSRTSVYSQEAGPDEFPPPANPYGRSSPSPTRASAFHLPNRAVTSPYGTRPTHSPSPDWI